VQALLAQGKKPGDVIVTTVDYYDDTDRFVREGWISAAMVQVPATMGAGVSTWPFVVMKDNADRIDLTTVRQAPADVMAGAYGRASFRHRGREDAKTRLRPGQLAIDRRAMRLAVSAICFSAAWRSRRRTSNTAMTENTSTGSSTATARTPRWVRNRIRQPELTPLPSGWPRPTMHVLIAPLSGDRR